MPDFKKMTVESLRELARKVLGPGHSKKSKTELIAALEGAGGKAAGGREAGAKSPASARPAGGGTAPRAKAAVRKGAEAAREGAKAGARAGKTGAGKAAADGAAAGARAAAKSARERKPGKVAAAVAAVAGAAAGAAAGVAAAARKPGKPARAAKPAKAAKAAPRRGPEDGPDPEGYFVARVRGEDAVRDAPHPMSETAGGGWSEAEEAVGRAIYQEHLGDLPWGYGDDAFIALPRDPRTLFLYWDWAQETLARGFEGLDHPRAQLWVFARAGEGWERVRVADFALESRGYYVHDLAPGRVYRAEIHVVDRAGRERFLGHSSTECGLPPVGPSPVIDDRFVRLPWDLPLGRLLGPGHAGGAFSDDARAILARLSDWSRFSGPTWGGSAGGMGGRPSSPTSSPSAPHGGEER